MRNLSFVRYAGLATVAFLGLIVLSATAQAQYGYYQSAGDPFNNGYQLGYGQGSNDRAYGLSFDINRSKAYRDADSGYSAYRQIYHGDRDTYKRQFRNAFEAGYQDGYEGAPRRGYYSSGYEYSYPRRRHRHERVYILPPY